VKRHAGIGLIEVLVALLIISLGLLGFASLQVANLNVGDTAWSRSSATLLASDLLDRARINRIQYLAGAYDHAFGEAAPSATDCRSNSCTPAQLSRFDLSQWLNQVSASLPGGQGQVSRDTSMSLSVLIVQVRWFDRLEQSNQTLELRAQL